MGEYIRYKGEEIKIGTMYELYYATYQKFTDALKAGQLLMYVNDDPGIYVLPDSGFKFRFPFPDEDHLLLGDIAKNHYNRGLPVTIDNAAIPYSNGDEHFAGTQYQIEITQQKLVHRQSDGKLCLALVYRDSQNGESYRIEDDKDVRRIIKQIIRHHVAGETNREKKNLYRQMALRILKGYWIDTPAIKPSQQATISIKATPVNKQRRSKGRGI